LLSFGPGLEFYDAPPNVDPGFLNQNEAAAVVAGKLARLFDANPGYNPWDARQHLRQTASGYATGWREDGGFGRPSTYPVPLSHLDPAPPFEAAATLAPDAKSVVFTWRNFLQTGYAATIIRDEQDQLIYQGNGTNCVWQAAPSPHAVFKFYSRDASGRLSRSEPCQLQRPPASPASPRE
jgi:hypothetical protein